MRNCLFHVLFDDESFTDIKEVFVLSRRCTFARKYSDRADISDIFGRSVLLCLFPK